MNIFVTFLVFFTGLYWALLGFTLIDKVLLYFTGLDWIALGFTGFYFV